MKLTCKDCGKEFILTQGEIDFYKKKGLNLPKRCKDCRKANKSSKAENPDVKPEINFGVKNADSGSKLKKILPVIVCALVIIGGAFGFDLFKPDGDNNSSSYTQPQEYSSYEEISVTEIETADYTSEAQAEEEEPEEYVVSYSGNDDYYTGKYRFRNRKLLNSHYEKHGIEMGFGSAEAYEAAASEVITNRNAIHKTEAEDGDGVFFIEGTGEIVFVSKDGYIRTYFISDKDYFDRQ